MQDYPADRMQVLVADGMSDDATRAIVEEIAATHPAHTVEIVDNPGGVVPTGFNAALSRARGEIVVRVDGHTIIAEDYVSACVTALAESGADTVGGRMDAQGSRADRGGHRPRHVVAVRRRRRAVPLRVRGALGRHRVHGRRRREVFDRVGGFDPEMVRNQDDEFNYRLRAAGGRILLTDRIRSRYYSRASLRTLFRQYRQYGFWKVRVLQKHPRQMSLRQFVPPVFAAAVAGGAVLAPTSRGIRRLWSATLAAYGLAAVSASVTVARRSGWRHLPLLPVAFAAMHLGYGGGFLAGLVRFARRWGERSEAPPPRPGLHAVATRAV